MSKYTVINFPEPVYPEVLRSMEATTRLKLIGAISKQPNGAKWEKDPGSAQERDVTVAIFK